LCTEVIQGLNKGFNFDEFKFGVLHDKYIIRTWKSSQHLLEDRGKAQRVLRWPVAGLLDTY
jgi:hypothetical protein